MSSLLTRRAIAFLAAVALAIVAAVSVLSYVRGVEQRVASEADAVIGYVATDTVEPGTLADSAIQLGVIAEREIPRTLLAPNAVTDLTQITGRVVQELILAGDQIILDRFAAPGQGVEILTIPSGHQAMSVQVGVPPGVAGFLRAGDHISVILNMDVPIEGSEVVTTDPATGAISVTSQTEPRAQYVVQDLEVLAVGRRTPPTEENPTGGQIEEEGGILLTVAVTPVEAEQLAFSVQQGSIHMTLLPEDETDAVATVGVNARTLFAR